MYPKVLFSLFSCFLSSFVILVVVYTHCRASLSRHCRQGFTAPLAGVAYQDNCSMEVFNKLTNSVCVSECVFSTSCTYTYLLWHWFVALALALALGTGTGTSYSTGSLLVYKTQSTSNSLSCRVQSNLIVAES